MEEATRHRLYEAYASNHAGVAEGGMSPAVRRDVLVHLPQSRSIEVVDIGCGQGQLVRAIQEAGYKQCKGIDISPEQVALAQAAGISGVTQGDYRTLLRPSSIDVAVATDFFEHLTKDEVVSALDSVFGALRPGGLLIARVPNAVSPFGGNYRHGDFTHETSFTPRSLHQLSATAGFANVGIYACPPVAHGLKSALRAAIWFVAASALKLALAAETGRLRGNIVTQNVVAVFTR